MPRTSSKSSKRLSQHASRRKTRGIDRASEAMASVFTPQGWARYVFIFSGYLHEYICFILSDRILPLHRFATSELLRASTAVDHACHAVVGAKRWHRHSDIADTLRDVALTIAVVERSLFAYADRIRIHSLMTSATKRSSSIPSQGSLATRTTRASMASASVCV